jgi:putative membrane-bound dehydrogenase-like protein
MESCFMKLHQTFLVFVTLLLLADFAVAEDSPLVPDFPRMPPLEPAEALKSFNVLHGFSMQLVASEPLIADPVDVAYDEDGRAYVVEMRDYPFPEEKGAVPTEFIGEVRLLEDINDDGVFDRSHVFADKLSWPTSVACWQGGIFVTAAPDLWYFKDTDGDHRADVRERVYTGFSRDNVQAIVNGLRWGLDNQIYGAASGNGGQIVPFDKSKPPVVVTRHDFRFDPQSREFQAIAGGARFGNSFDDWGNRFVCNIRNPVQHVVPPPLGISLFGATILSAPNPIHDVAESGDQLLVHRISPPEAWRVFRAQRWTSERVNFPRSELVGAGYWTSSSGVTIYRGGAYPGEFRGNAFIGEVAGNLVHRQVLQPDGVTFVSRRADENAEFVASRDTWFRPVNFVNAPDGTLHVLDMYRETIEHPWSIPDDIKAKLDLRSGNNRGRIYRLAPPGFVAPKKPKLSTATTAELVAALESPHGWWRETAQRLIFERQDWSAVEPLEKLISGSQLPQARLHALYALHGLISPGSIPLDSSLANDWVRAHEKLGIQLTAALHDNAPQVRRHAVRLASQVQHLPHGIILAAQDDDAGVRFEAAAALRTGSDKNITHALSYIAARDSGDEWIRTAALASASGSVAVLTELIQQGISPNKPGAITLISELSRTIAASGDLDKTRQAAQLLERIPAVDKGLSFALVSGLGAGLQQRRQTLTLLTNENNSAAKAIAELLARASHVARDQHTNADERISAMGLLRFTAATDAMPALNTTLSAREPLAIQNAAVRVIQSYASDEAAKVLIERWKVCSASTGQQIVDALLTRARWTELLVAALETDAIRPAQLTIPQRGRLVAHADKKLQDRAVRLLGPAATSVRSAVIKEYQPALSLAGDRARGEQVYRRECMTCHRLGNTGFDVGPNLNTIKHRSAQEVLVHVFDPNREIAPQFISYSIQLVDGRVLAGLIANDTAAAIELQRAENVRETVSRQDIEEIVSTGKSLMPEGMEQKINQQDVADLIAFLLRQDEFK